MSVEANGLFADSATEQSLRQLAMSNGQRNFQLVFGNGDNVTGMFQITRYQRRGDYGDAERYNVQLESTGAVSYVESS